VLTEAGRIIVDTGPLVAVLNQGDEFHQWACGIFANLTPPLCTCEAVLSEVQFLLDARGGDPLTVLEMVRKGVLIIDFKAEFEIERLIEMQRSYRNLPMDFADACLVRMAEIREAARILTTDSHFRIFRREKRRILSLIAPPGI
jgi:predicted nucleic acid-binding protein